MVGEPLAHIRGIPNIPTVTQINVRPDPSTANGVLFRAAIGTDNLTILDVQPDAQQNKLNGKIYQWFKLAFPNSAVGWVRDDLLNVQGELKRFGYPDQQTRVFAHPLHRAGTKSTTPQPEPEPTPVLPPQVPESPPDVQPVVNEQTLARVRRKAFLITGAFEGSGYAAYNNNDRGIVSYGIIQFTLAAGSLATVLERYLNNSESETAEKLRPYFAPVRNRDPNLRNDAQFRDLLIAAADEEAMRDAQDFVAGQGFWQRVIDGYIVPRRLTLPLSYALLFDMGVNFGVNHRFVRNAEDQLGVPQRSIPGENGITEEQLIARVAELRKQSHDQQALEENLPGLRVRGDFWVDLVRAGDWGLTGGDDGAVVVFGRRVDISE